MKRLLTYTGSQVANRVLASTLLWLCLAGPALAQQPAFLAAEGSWARTTLAQLTVEEKIAQLFMVDAYTLEKNTNQTLVEGLIRKQKIGGIICMQGTPWRQATLVNRYQELSKLPLLVSADAEWGLAMRLDSVLAFPKNMTLGAIQDDSLLYRYGLELARQLRAAGVHLNFAPVADVNNNAYNPVINDRAFGENQHLVARKAAMVMKGMQDGGLMACAKHFPGHGDTNTDSHKSLPQIKHSRARLDSLELFPFRELIRQGIMSVMVAHLHVPALDRSGGDTPSTLSHAIISDLLKTEMGFQGLVITDALNMGAIKKDLEPGSVELQAYLAGNDILLFSQQVEAGIQKIKQAIADGQTTEAELDRRVLKILLAKEWLGLNRQRMVNPAALRAELDNPAGAELRRQLYANAVTLAANEKSLLPLRSLNGKKIAIVQVADEDRLHTFLGTARKYGTVSEFYLSSKADKNEAIVLAARLKDYDAIVIAVHDMKRYAYQRFGVGQATPVLQQQLLRQSKPVATVLFGNPYALQYFTKGGSIVVAYEEAAAAQVAAAEVVFGARKPTGQLPAHTDARFKIPAEYGALHQPLRFGFGTPQGQGLNADVMAELDTMIPGFIRRQCMPGCALLVARGNEIVWEKGYGTYDYSPETAVDPYNTVYDLASVTKVAATTLALMRLYEEGLIKLGDPARLYLPDLAGRPVGNLTLVDLLSHRTGLTPWIPFHRSVAKKGWFDPKVFSAKQERDFTIPVSPGLYLHQGYPDSVWGMIRKLETKPNPEVQYSDLNLIILARVVESIICEPMDTWLDRHFYQPLGMDHTLFNPFRFSGLMQCIPPTVQDKEYRLCKIQGYVNDQTATLLGGYSGHAGLFSNVYDMAKLLLMLKNGGEYAGVRYFKPETVSFFTQAHKNDSRRGLGWDKPEPDPAKIAPVPRLVPLQAFGHLGFTGTSIWADPVNDLVFVFLSNRTYPDDARTNFNKEEVRPKVMYTVYRALQIIPEISDCIITPKK